MGYLIWMAKIYGCPLNKRFFQESLPHGGNPDAGYGFPGLSLSMAALPDGRPNRVGGLRTGLSGKTVRFGLVRSGR